MTQDRDQTSEATRADFELEVLHDLLCAHPFGLPEHALLERLAEQAGRARSRCDDEHDLFRRHFLLFNALYRLRGRLRASGEGDLEIHCLGIRLLAHRPIDSRLPALPDPLEQYYLDLSQLEKTGPAEVRALLDDFWSMFAAHDRRDEALAVLGLEGRPDRRRIEARYRELALELHPDRGGDAGAFARLREAVDVLRACPA